MSENFVCTIPMCGRTFLTDKILKSHQQRRHPNIFKFDGQEQQSKAYPDSPRNTNIKSETGYDFDAMQNDLREMQDLQKSIKLLANQAEEMSQSTPEEEFRQMLLMEDVEKSKSEQFSTENQRKGKILDIELVIRSSKIDSKSVDSKKFPGLELIEEIDLRGAGIVSMGKTHNFNPFNLKSLTKIDLSRNFLKSVVSLEACFNLEELLIDENQVENFGAIRQCPRLKKIFANRNCVMSLEEFQEMDSLEVLELEGNKINRLEANLEYLASMKQLQELVLKGNECAKQFSYQYEILLKSSLKKLDREKVLDADYEIARAFKKHFLMQGNEQIRQNLDQNQGQRPQTAHVVQRQSISFGDSGKGQRKFVGRFESMKEVGRSVKDLKVNSRQIFKESLEKETLSAIKETNCSDYSNEDVRYDILKEEFEELRKENTELRGFLTTEQNKVEDLESENKKLKLQNQVLQSQVTCIPILETENKDLRKKLELLDIRESPAGVESIESYKGQIDTLNSNVDSFLDEITRLNNILAQIKANGGTKGIPGLDEELRNNAKDFGGVFGDDAVTLSSQRSIRTQDMSIGAKVGRILDKKGPVIHAKLYGRDRVNSTQSLDDSVISDQIRLKQVDDSVSNSYLRESKLTSKPSSGFKIRRTNSINNSMVSESRASIQSGVDNPVRNSSAARQRPSSRHSKISRQSKNSSRLDPIPNKLRIDISKDGESPDYEAREATEDNHSQISNDSIEAFLRETQEKFERTKKELGLFSHHDTDVQKRVALNQKPRIAPKIPANTRLDQSLENSQHLSASELSQPSKSEYRPRAQQLLDSHRQAQKIPGKIIKPPARTSSKIKLHAVQNDNLGSTRVPNQKVTKTSDLNLLVQSKALGKPKQLPNSQVIAIKSLNQKSPKTRPNSMFKL